MKILVVDDSPSDRKILRFIFEAHACTVVEAGNGSDGLRVAATEKPDLVISDALMPVMDGFTFLRNLKADLTLAAIPFIFYSAVYTGDNEEKLARALGAEDFLVKPKEPETLWEEVMKLLEKRKREDVPPAPFKEEEEYLKEYSSVVVAKLEEKVNELEDLFVKMVQVLVNLLDAKSPWTKGHSERVAAYAVAIARELGLDDYKVRVIRLGALLHDIGKIGTCDELLDKASGLSEEEYEVIKHHPQRGADALEGICQLGEVVPLIRMHHEKLDGTGYPAQLAGSEIPLPARILSVADSFDSMISNRPYRCAQGGEYAQAQLRKCSGSQFDPEVVNALLRVLERDSRHVRKSREENAP